MKSILSITENGYGKLSSAYEYRITNRGGSGVTNITITPKMEGSSILKVNLDDNIALISDSGKLLLVMLRKHSSSWQSISRSICL